LKSRIVVRTNFFYKHGLFLAEPGKEIEITTSKLTTICIENKRFQPERAYKPVAYKKKKCINRDVPTEFQSEKTSPTLFLEERQYHF